jgi:hypothetical protein
MPQRLLTLLTALALVVTMPLAGRAATSLQYSVGTAVTMLSTEMNGITSNSYTSVGSAIYDNAVGQNGGGATRCRVEVFVTFQTTTPTANTQILVWLVKSADGTNYEITPTSAITPGSALQLSFPVNSGTGQLITRGVQDIDCPPGKMKAVLKNDGTAQTFATSGNTVKIYPVTLQGN